LTKLQTFDVIKLSIAVDELNIQYLVSYIQEYLIKHRDDLLQQNLVEILEAFYQHELFTDLCNYCLEKICKDPEMLFDSDKFIGLKAPLLELLLKRDDLCIDEIVIWDNLLKWGFAQNPSVSHDNTKWSKEKVTIMKRTLHRYIPLIRFYYISPEDFLGKVYPLKKLLPKDLVDNLLTFHITPNKKSDIDKRPPRKQKFFCDSILIESQHFAIFSSWIDKKENLHYNRETIPYIFNLLYRASRDDMTAASFHEKCNNKGATIVIAKIQNSEQIVGGYNPLEWDSDFQWKSTKDSFIFSFINRTNTETAKVGYSNGQSSLGCFSNYGPIFGAGHDLSFHPPHGYWSSNPLSYPNVVIPNTFNVNDYEVFQVIKK